MSRYSMRAMQPKDVPRLIDLHAEQNRRDRTTYPLPRMFQPDGRLDENIALALSMTRDNAPIQGIVFGCKQVEMMFVGCNPRATLYSAREIQGVRHTLRALKYEAINCKIPHSLVGLLQDPLEGAGFKRTDEQFAHFYQELHLEGE